MSLLTYFRRRKDIQSLLTILPGVTTGDGSLNICLVRLSPDRAYFVFVDNKSIYTAPVASIDAIVYRVREALLHAE